MSNNTTRDYNCGNTTADIHNVLNLLAVLLTIVRKYNNSQTARTEQNVCNKELGIVHTDLHKSITT